MAKDLRRTPSKRGDEAVRITTAATSPQADISARQRRYVISMAIRTLCFLAAILVGPGWVRWVLVAAAIVLPYVAVVMANAATSKTDAFELRPGQFQAELPPGRTEPDDPR